ncbi:MAG: lysylphosphatidylglycerol synthase domain-containing protein [Bacteroidota bacterium]
MWNKKTKDRLLKLLILAGAWALVWYQFSRSQDKNDVLEMLISIPREKLIYLFSILLLMLLNWTIEAVKWKYLAGKLQPFGFWKALRSVISGVSIGMFTPNRTGEFAGRIVYLRHENRAEGAVLSMIGSFSQFFTTIFVGIPALILYLLVFSHEGVISGRLSISVMLSVATSLVLMILYFRLDLVYKFLRRFSRIEKQKEKIRHLKTTSRRDLLLLLGLSILRYSVFILQFYLICIMFGLNIAFWQVFLGAANLYFLMSLLPVFTLGEPGLRGSLTGIFFQAFTMQIAGIISASVLLWIINVLLVALAGAIFLLTQKILNYESKTSS